MMDYQIAREKIISEININNLTDGRLYRFVVSEIFNGDIKQADAFLLDPVFGGYTPGAINKIKSNMKRAKKTFVHGLNDNKE